MSNKIALVFENNEYAIKLNEIVLNKEKDIDRAFEIFKQEIKNNSVFNAKSWESITDKIKSLGIEAIDINNEYKAMSLGNMKYFNHTDKVFYMGQGKMIQLIGGFDFFYNVLQMLHEKQLEDSEALVALCGAIIEKNANYSLSEDGLVVTSAVFSYGTVGYNFTNGKMNKGTSSEKCSFDTFVDFVLKAI